MPRGTLLALFLLACSTHAGASPLFDESTVVEVELIGPLGALFEDKEATIELPFVLRANDREHAIQVRLRGKSRRRVCDFPPLRLDFVVGEAPDTIFTGQDKLKLVTHCQRLDSAQSDTLQEYAAYQIFNLISNVGYRVRLLQITYKDTEGGLEEDAIERFGFLIESDLELADRVGGETVEVPGVSMASLDSQQLATVFTFQYLIGNTDWSLVMADTDDTCCHNGDLFDIGGARYFVPYDFDLSGLVNTRYAKPDPSLRIRRVTQRLYRGYCMSSDDLRDAIVAIKGLKDDILGVPGQVPGLPEEEITSTIRYLDQFFDQAKDEEALVQLFERRCI